MEPYIPQGDDEEEDWQRWKAKRARHREEKAIEEREIQKRLGESKGAAMNCLLVFIIAISVVNFVIFEAVAGFVGGRATHGKVEDGRFYVGNHGHYTEVTKKFFDYSQTHGTWTFRSFLVSLGSGVLLGIRKAKEVNRRERLLRRLNQLLN
jgi:hypothetical protein